jgi:c-di-GMP-binding flagellar brake protein YcgR
MEEHRQHPRYAIELDAEAVFDGKRLAGRTHDISRGGFSLVLKERLPVSSQGHVKLALVFSENQFSEQLTLPATIVWCTPFGGGFQVGIKFSGLSEEIQGYLSLFIQFLEGGDGDEEDDEEETDEEEEPDDD